MEQQEGIKSLLKDVASREGKQINDEQINTVISQYNGDYQKLITDIGKRQGVTDDKLDKFQNLVNQKYKLTDWEEYNKQGEEKLSKAGRPTAYEGTMDNESGLAAAQDFMTSGVKDMAPKKPVDPYDGGQDIEAVKNAPRVVEYPGKLPKQIEEEKQIINSLESYIEQKKEELGKKKRSYAYSGPQMSFVTGGQAIDNSEIRALDQAQDLLKKAKRYNDNPKGFIDGFTSPLAKDILTAGLTDMTRNLNLANALNKENPTEEERLLIEAYKLFDKAQNSSDPDFWYQSGQTVAEAIPYIIQFALTRGGNVAARKAAEAGLKKVIKNNVVRKGIGYTTGAVAQAPLMPQMYSQLGQERIDGKDWGRAISSAWTKTAGETFGEGAGDLFQKGLFRLAGSELGEKLFKRFRSNFTKAIGWNGPWEVVEENITNAWNATFTDERSWSDFTSWHEQGLIAVSTVVMGVPFAAQNQIARRNTRKDYQKATDILVNNHGNETKNRIDQIYDQYNMEKTLADFHSLADNMEADQRQASMEYLMNKFKIDGVANYLSNDSQSRINFIQQYNQSLNRLDDLDNSDYIEAVKKIAQNTTDQEQISTQFKEVTDLFSGQIDMDHILAAKEYLGNALTYSKINEARRAKIDKEISNFKDNQGNITTATIDGQKWSIRNAQDLGQENKAIFAKSPDGTVRAFMSHNVKEWETKSSEDIKDEIIAQQDAQDEEMVSQMEPQIVNEQEHEMPNGDKVTIAQFDNGQYRMNLNGEESIFNNAEAMQQWFQENQTQEEDKETEPEAEAEINLDEIDLNEYSPQEFSDILAKKGYTPEEINEELMIERENIEKEIEKLSKDKTTDRNKRIKNKEQLKQKFAQLNEIDAILNKTTSEQETQQNIPENDENNLSDQEKVSQTKMLSAENQDNENLEDQESFQKSQPEEIDGEQKSQELTIPEGLNPDQVTDWVLENSNDPVEIVAAHEQEQSNIPANALQPWEEDMLNRKVRRSDVAEKIGKDIVDEEFSRYWLNGKEGAALDQIAQELSDIHGVNISEQDIIDLMYKYPNGNARKTTEKQKALEDKFKQITGVTFNKRDEYFDKQENKGTSIPQEKLATILNDFWTEEGYDLDNLYKNLFGKERKAFQEKYGISDTQIASLKNMVKSSPDQLQSSWTEENPVPFRTTTPEEVLLSLNEGVDTKIEILDSVDDLPSSIRNHPNFPGRRFSGAYMASNNTAYFIKENIKDAGTAIDLWVHEVGAHAGLIKLLPNKQLRDQFFDHVWNEANKLAKNDPEIAQIINHVKQSYGNNPSILGEEFLAYYAEKYVAQNGVPKAHQSFWESILSKFKEILEKTFNFDSSLTRSDLDHIVKTAILKNYERTTDQPETSRGISQRKGDVSDGSQDGTREQRNEVLREGETKNSQAKFRQGRVLSGIQTTEKAKESLKFKSNTLTGLDKVAQSLDIPVNVVHSSETESDKAVSYNPEDGSVEIVADKTRSVVATKKAFIQEIIANKGLDRLFSGKEQKRFNRLKEEFKDVQNPLSDQTYVDKLTHLTRRAFGLTSKQLSQDDLKGIIKNGLRQDDVRFRTREEIKKLKEENKDTYPKVKTNNIFFNPQEQLPYNIQRAIEQKINDKDFNESEVSILEIIPTQKNLTIDNLLNTENVNENVEIAEVAGRYYVVDGHHRIANAILDGGDSINANVYQVEGVRFRTIEELTGSENFKNWFKDSKITDKEGNPLIVYHQTSKANEQSILNNKGFDISKGRARLNDDQVPDGFFFKPDDRDISVGASGEDMAQMPLFLSIQNPLIAKDRNDLSSKLFKMDDEYRKLYQESQAYDKEKGKEFDKLDKEWQDKYLFSKEDKREKENADKYFQLADDFIEEWKQGNIKNATKAREKINEILNKEGYDGVILEEDAGSWGRKTKTFIALNPTQIKSINNEGGFSLENPDIRFRTDNFYSPTERALSKIKQDKGTPEQFKAMLLKNGAKQAELDWMGWDDFATGKKSLTVDDIQDWIDQNKVEIQEVEKGNQERRDLTVRRNSEDGTYEVVSYNGEVIHSGISEREAEDYIDSYWDGEGGAKHSQWQLPGGENYRELLLTMPRQGEKEYYENHKKWVDYQDKMKDKYGENYYPQMDDKERKEYSDIEKSVVFPDANDFKSSHFDEPNILAHVRFNERTDKDGNRILFLEELQSDWQASGRKKGFKGNYTPETLPEEYTTRYRESDDRIVLFKDNEILGNFNNIDEAVSWLNNQGVPNMPFKKTDQWVNLALRRIMKYAADNNFDGIAWTPGEVQAERYDLSKQIDNIVYHRKYNLLEATDKQGRDVISQEVPESELEDVVGKEVAEKLINQRKKQDEQRIKQVVDAAVAGGMSEEQAKKDITHIIEEPLDTDERPTMEQWSRLGKAVGETLNLNEVVHDFNFDSSVTLENQDLKVGGEGMIGFYNKIVPSQAKKVGKPFGSRLTTTEIDTKPELTDDGINLDNGEIGEKTDGKWLKVQAMPVTPQMTEAMPMFRVAPPTDSKAFKEWFGDSKVVDENGEPLVVYHGTTKDFNIFDLSKQGKNTGDSFNTKVGFYFTQDETLADDFTKRNWTKPTTKNKKNASILPVYLSILNPQRISARQFVNGYFNNNTREKLINQGYDGVIIEPFTKEDKESWDNIFGENSGSKEFDYPQYVAFSPTQIKSATGNKGTYDPQNPDIRFKVAKRNDDKYKKSFFQPTKEIAYSAALASELFSDLGVRITIPSKSFSSLPVETQRTMMFRMIGAINDSKIRKFIISLIPVDVMNDLIGSEVSPDVLLNNPSMLIKSFAFNGSIPVSVGRFFDSLANSVASLGAEYSFSPSLGINLRRAKIENDSANRTNEVNSIWEAGIVTSDGTEISSLDLRRSSKEILPASVTSDTNLIGVSNGNTFSGTTVPGSNDFSRDKLNFFSTYDAINNRHSINFKGYFGKDTKNLYNKAIENGFDVFIGPNPESDKVYVVDQVDPDTGRFDEHKVILGTNNISEARKLYLAAYEPGWEGLGNITRTDKKGLKNWFSNGNTKEEFAETGIRFKSESADEEFRKFNESFKKLLKSGAVAQKIDQLKKEMDDKSLSDVTYEKIKQEIDTLKQGARLGKKETKEQIKAVQTMLVQYAKKNMPLDAAGRQDVGIILTSIKNAHTPYMLNKAMNRINELSKSITTKSLLTKFDKLLNRKHTKSQSGKPVGTINPDVLEVIEKIKAIRNMSYEQLEDYADDLKDDNVEDIALLSIFGSLDERSPEAINDALNKLQQIVDEGKIWYKVEQEQRMSSDQNLRDQAIESITAGKGVPSMQDLISEKKEPKDSLSKSFLTKNQALEWLLDWISNDKSEKTGYGWMQNYFGDKLNKSVNASNKGIRETIELINEKASEIFGKGKHALAKKLRDNARKIEKSGVTYQKNGERVEIPLSQNQAYKRWMEMQDDTLRPTFEKMGWDDISLSELEEFIKPDVMQWAMWQLYEFYPNYYNGVNEAYKKAYFTNLPHNPLYTPIKREVTTVGDKEDSMLRPTDIISSVANRSLKSRVKNTHHILLSDGDGILARHIAEMEHFKAWVETIRELRSVIGSRAVQDAIKKTSGNSVRTAINDRINSLARGGADRADVNHLLDRVRSNFVTSALGLNITLFPKQLVSVAAYMNDLSLTEMISGMKEFVLHPKKAIDIMNQSELIKNRYKKGWTHEIEAALKSSSPNLLAGSRSFMNQLRDILLIATKLGDRFGIFGGYPVYVKYAKEYKKNHPNATEKEVHDYAMNWFERIVGRSQQSSEIKDTSKLQEGSVGKLFTMFKNSQQQYFRYEMAAIRNLIKGRGNTAHNIKILVNTHIVLPVLFQAVTNLFTDDDEKTEGLRLLRAGILGSWNGLLIAGDIIESGLERAMGENWQFSFSPVFSTVDDLLAGTSKLHKYATEGETEDLQKAIDYLMQFTSSTMTGIPYEPVKRHYNKLSGKTDVENSVKRTNKELNDIIDKYKDGPKHESASSLKYKYSSIKSKATRLENEGDVKEAERLRKIVEDSKINMSESDFSVKEIKEEIDRLDYLSN